MKLTDQAIDSREYIKRYLDYTNRHSVRYESLMTTRQESRDELASGVDQRAILQDFNSLMEIKQQEILTQSLSVSAFSLSDLFGRSQL